jgi:hypothetical protein
VYSPDLELTVPEAHSSLYHYTTGEGLEGILSSNQLWATNIAYLNDQEEHVGYFDRRLGEIVAEAIDSLKTSPTKSDYFLNWLANDANNGKDSRTLADQFANLVKTATLKHNEPYVVSFSASPPDNKANDGMLSQWRAYGSDGGYAIVFDTKKLEEALKLEAARYQYLAFGWGDVEYYSAVTRYVPRYPETRKRESKVTDTIQRFLLAPTDPSHFEEIYEAITALSITHKHNGFEEEAEIRIFAALPQEGIRAAFSEANSKPIRPIYVRSGGGSGVPYLKLFEADGEVQPVELPIQKIVIGPHREKEKRALTVRHLLNRYKRDAEVVISGIPFVNNR